MMFTGVSFILLHSLCCDFRNSILLFPPRCILTQCIVPLPFLFFGKIYS
uniref:Uncharacterized protein n=1 Tax=Arundo donax TaxID=35708 RepID=A0A0A9C979_ARUDO